MIGLAALLVFCSIVLVGRAAANSLGQREAAREAIRQRLVARAGRAPEHGSILKDRRFSRIPLLDAVLVRLKLTAPLVRLIRQAGLANRVGEFVLYIPLFGCVGALIGMLLTDRRVVAVLLGVVAAALPVLYVRGKQRTRMRLFSEQLPDALDLVRAALQAGHSLGTALVVVADEFPNPVAEEFRVVAEEMRLGLPLRDALYGLRDRVDDVNVPILVVGVLVAQEVGGNLAEVLDSVAYTIRERFKLLRDVQVMTSQGRFSGRVLTALPVLGGIFMYLFNPKYFAPMLTDPRGLYLMGYAVLSMIVGHVIISRIVQIKV
jgi:tight adherence protein B